MGLLGVIAALDLFGSVNGSIEASNGRWSDAVLWWIGSILLGLRVLKDWRRAQP